VTTEVADVFAVQPKRADFTVCDFSWTALGTQSMRPASLQCWASYQAWFARLVGQYALGLALVYPVMILTTCSLRSVMTSIIAVKRFGHYLGLRH